MKYWIFIATNQKVDGQIIEAREILETRLSDKFWGLGQRTANRKWVEAGDKVVFYEGNPSKSFVATATLKTASVQLTQDQREELSHGQEVYVNDFGVFLEDTQILDEPIRIEQVVENLTFIENKEYWFSYFQGGTREIFEEDFYTITRALPTSLAKQIIETEDLESESQFALEAHLEEFIYNNWGQIDFGENLVLYSDGEQNGRQYPAGTWSIDFLCRNSNGEFVVIELKRGKTSDAVVGQVLRYVGWVKETLAESNQKVKGIIIAHEIDDALKFAASTLDDVRVMTYRVDFRLEG